MKDQTIPRDRALELLDELKEAAITKGITHQEIADKIGWGRGNVSRVLRGAYIPKLDNFLKLAQAIGVEIKIKCIAALVAVGMMSCEREEITPQLPECPGITILTRGAGEIHFTIDSTEPFVTICNPDNGQCTTVMAHYYKCISMPITTVLIMNNQCVIQ